MGRFLSVDPGFDVQPENPQSWNLYAYVRNNPVNATDPMGLFSLAGDDDAKKKALAQLSEMIGMEVTVGKDGKVERQAGPPDPAHQNACAVFDKAAAADFTLYARSGFDGKAVGDDFASQEMYPDQLAALPSDPSNLGGAPKNAVTRAEALVHILTEYTAAGGDFSRNNFQGSHETGLKAENDFRKGTGQKPIVDAMQPMTRAFVKWKAAEGTTTTLFVTRSWFGLGPRKAWVEYGHH